MGLKMLELAGELFFSTTVLCVCLCMMTPIFFFLIVSNYISLSLLCSPTALVTVCDLKVPCIAKASLD